MQMCVGMELSGGHTVQIEQGGGYKNLVWTESSVQLHIIVAISILTLTSLASHIVLDGLLTQAFISSRLFSNMS